MKPFQLDRVLDHKKRLEDITANRLFEAKRQEKLVKKKLSEKIRHLKSTIEKTEKLQTQTIPILDLINYENQIQYMKNTILAIKKKLQEKTAAVEREYLSLIEKSKNRQILESLKEQQNRSWKQYLDKQENSVLDEIAITKHEEKTEL